jgi:hypothetical protein
MNINLMAVHDLAMCLRQSETNIHRLANAGQVSGCRAGQARLFKNVILWQIIL